MTTEVGALESNQDPTNIDRLNYYEENYNSSICGFKRYLSNFSKQSTLVKSNVVLAFGIAIILIFEFAATY